MAKMKPVLLWQGDTPYGEVRLVARGNVMCVEVPYKDAMDEPAWQNANLEDNEKEEVLLAALMSRRP